MQSRRLKTLEQLKKRHQKLHRRVSFWNQRVQKYQQARLIVALAFCISLVPLAMNEKARWGYLLASLLLLAFIGLVIRTRLFVRFRNSLDLDAIFTQRQIARLQGLPSGRAWKTAHEKAAALKMIPDLGLTGGHSLWTLLDETLTEAGQDQLLYWLRQTPASPAAVQSRQKQIQALRPLRWFYTKLTLTLETEDLQATKGQLLEFIEQPTIGPTFSKILAVNLLIWIPTAVLFFMGLLKVIAVPNWTFLAFPLLSWLSLGSVATVFSRAVGLSHYLAVLSPLLQKVELKAKKFSGLQNICPRLLAIEPSKQLQNLERILGFLGTQTNPLLHFVVNALTPWTLVSVFFLERARKNLAREFPTVLQELAEFEVYGSLLIFDKFQTQSYPELTAKNELRCERIFHPLINQERVVANSFKFENTQTLGLLTGSNMSGKSTFLRTIGLNQILANMGAPVFADAFITSCYEVETCIEVSDSLRDGYSYFYAEVRRLKDILENSQSSKSVLFLIDEIFRGTNNRERQVGSRAVITQLAHAAKSLGFVSTHDLELTNLSEQVKSVVNLHFREDIDSNGSMTFSYELNKGPCPTTNALRIMEAEGLLKNT